MDLVGEGEARPLGAPRRRRDRLVGQPGLLPPARRGLIPEKDREIPRDLFGLLAYTWAAQAGRGDAYDPHRVLRAVRARAWLGYADTQALVAMTRQELPRSEVGRRMVAFYEELAAKRSTYLF